MVPPRPVTADDLERDRVLSQRIALFGWVEEKHLDIPQGEGSKGFVMFAQQGMSQRLLEHYCDLASYFDRTHQNQSL
jgi:Rab5 GDP/GTP exchange factor